MNASSRPFMSWNESLSPMLNALPSTKKTSIKATKKAKRRRAYVVKAGDTLSAISIKTGVSLATIQRLNPKLEADTLHAGQRVRLSR